MKEDQEERVRDSLLRSLRVTKDHNDRKIEELLDHLRDNKSSDDLPFVGSKYHNRLKQFEALQLENQELKEEMRRMQQQVLSSKHTPYDSQLREDEFLNKESVDKGQAVSQTRMGTNQTSLREMYKQKMEQIEKMKTQARELLNAQNIMQNELLGALMKYMEYGYTKGKLENQIQPIQHRENSQDMVSVPRRRYDQLMQIYAINMSDICAKELLKIKNDSTQDINFKNQSKEQYKQKYVNIVKDNLEISDLGVFFRMLAQKFGFEKEWERYHTNNMNEAINLKSKLQSIIDNQHQKAHPQPQIEWLSSQQKPDKKEEDKMQKKTLKEDLRQKLDKIVQLLPFSSMQRNYWKTLTQKIHTDTLINIQNIKEEFDKAIVKKNVNLRQQLSSLVSTIFEKWSQNLSVLLESRYNSKIICSQQLKNHFKQEQLQKKLQQKQSQSRSSIWQLSKSLSGQILEEVTKQLSASLLFVATGSLPRKLNRIR